VKLYAILAFVINFWIKYFFPRDYLTHTFENTEMLVGVVAPPVPRVSNMIGEVDLSWYAWNLFTIIFNIIILKLFKNTKKKY
jgi:hypothetical protein